jgi:hypothetical protein
MNAFGILSNMRINAKREHAVPPDWNGCDAAFIGLATERF